MKQDDDGFLPTSNYVYWFWRFCTSVKYFPYCHTIEKDYENHLKKKALWIVSDQHSFLYNCDKISEKLKLFLKWFGKALNAFNFFRNWIECFQTFSEGNFEIPKMFGNFFDCFMIFPKFLNAFGSASELFHFSKFERLDLISGL